MPQEKGRGSAVEAYDRMAPIYDEFNAGNNYEVWLGEVLLPELEKHGLQQGGRVLDVGCGTGRAVPPLLARGWDVTGIDSSSEMLEQAREKYEGHVAFMNADARELPVLTPPHNLIFALNDVVNYLTEDGDLERFFGGVQKNLASHGLLCFDANTLGVYEGAWVAGAFGGMRDRGWDWTGLTEKASPGNVFEAEVGADGIEMAIHRQRHWPRPSVEAAMGDSGLRCISAMGQRGEAGDITLEEVPDEARHQKTIYIGANA